MNSYNVTNRPSMNHANAHDDVPLAPIAPADLLPLFVEAADPHEIPPWLIEVPFQNMHQVVKCDSLYAECLLPNPDFLHELTQHNQVRLTCTHG